MRHTLVPDLEQFKQYYSRGQQGGSIAGFRSARTFSKVLHALQFPW